MYELQNKVNTLAGNRNPEIKYQQVNIYIQDLPSWRNNALQVLRSENVN
jgi:hypothetical protein